MKLQIVGGTLLLGLSLGPAIAGPSEGKEVFDKSCKACHGAQGQGNPAMAKILKVEMRQLGSTEVQAQSDADLKKIITQGKGKMKAQSSLSAKQVDDVVAFVRTLKQ
jgi:mono/diheme cytochrome c family protein